MLDKSVKESAKLKMHSEVLPANMVVKAPHAESPRGEAGNSSRQLKSDQKAGDKASLQESSIEGSCWNYYDYPPLNYEDV